MCRSAIRPARRKLRPSSRVDETGNYLPSWSRNPRIRNASDLRHPRARNDFDIGAANRSGMIIFREWPCRHQHRHEFVPFGSQAILDTWRLLTKVGPINKAIMLE